MIARIIEAAARHRWMVFLGVACAAALAVWSMRRVEVDAIPNLDDPQVIVFTEWKGRSPTLVEDQITYPIVSRLVAAPQVTDVRGYSMFGMSFVYVLFEEDTDLYWARSRVLEYMNGIQASLPEGVTPELGPDATGTGWVFQYTLVDRRQEAGGGGGGTGGTRLDELRTFQDFTLRYALGSVPGVAEVASIGGYEKQYQITVDPERMRGVGVTVDQVIDAVRDSTTDVGGRVIEMSGREYYVRGRGYAEELADLEKVVVLARGERGVPVLVRDVATVAFGPEIRRGVLEWNGEGEAVGGIVVMRQGENARDVIARVKARLADVGLPEGVSVEIAYDRSALIDRAVGTLKDALIEEGIAVAIVIILFLLHLRSALLPILSLPLAVALAFIPMYFLGIPSTIMSLGGIAIALGAAVDAEIVMIEAAHKKLEHAPPGADRHALLTEAAREVTPAIFFSLLIIAVAFLPVFALEGQAGRLFHPLAFTKTFVMLAAALLSITFAPALRDLVLRGKLRPESRHPISRAIIAIYKPFVYVALRKPKSTLAIGLLAVLSALPLLPRLKSEFMPALDEGDILYMPTTLPGLSIEEAKAQLQYQDRILREFPEVMSVAGKIGRAGTATDPAPLTMVETVVRLKPREQWRTVKRDRWYSSWAPDFFASIVDGWWPEERPMTWAELTAEMDAKLQLPGWTNAWTMPIKTRIDMQTTGIRTPVGIKVLGADLAAIDRIGTEIERLLRALPGTRSVLYERAQGGQYVDIVPDRDALARYGLTVGDLGRIVETAIGGAPVATTIDGRARFSINVRYPQDTRSDLDALRALLVPLDRAMGAGVGGAAGADGAAAHVPLGQVADVRVVAGPPMVRNENGMLAGYVYVDIDDSTTDLGGYVGSAKAAVDAARRSGELPLPRGFSIEWSGQYEQMASMVARMKIVIPLTLLIIVVLLFLMFRHAVEVLIVLLSIPFALVGSVWLLWILDYRMSTAVWVGVIALVGLAAQTGIVMIVYIDNAFERRRRAGMIRNLDDIVWAHLEGTVMRVRPKLMTVITMLASLMPLLWADGTGADVMKRIAAPMVGGLLTSTFLTLEIIPVVYTYWRYEQLLHERLRSLAPARRAQLRELAGIAGAALAVIAAMLIAPIYVDVPDAIYATVLGAGALVTLAALIAYVTLRRPAKQIVWPQ